MSSRTPQECVTLAVDTTAPREAREDAIDDLRRANECDELADIAMDEGLETDYRRYALRAVATTQCDATLRDIVDRDDLEPSLQREAEALLHDLDSD